MVIGRIACALRNGLLITHEAWLGREGFHCSCELRCDSILKCIEFAINPLDPRAFWPFFQLAFRESDTRSLL